MAAIEALLKDPRIKPEDRIKIRAWKGQIFNPQAGRVVTVVNTYIPDEYTEIFRELMTTNTGRNNPSLEGQHSDQTQRAGVDGSHDPAVIASRSEQNIVGSPRTGAVNPGVPQAQELKKTA